MKRPAVVKIDVVKPPSALIFNETLIGRRGISIYATKILEALQADSVIRILKDDLYLRQQFNLQGKKLKIKLVYALDGTYLFIKPIRLSESYKNLMLFLREPRSLNELMARKYELPLDSTLQELKEKHLVHIIDKGLHKDKYILTEQGHDAL